MKENVLLLGKKILRENQISNKDWKNAIGKCRDLSWGFYWILVHNGYKADVIHGSYNSTNPDIDRNTPHYWVVIENKYIADLSIYQFEFIQKNEWLREINDNRYSPENIN